MKKLRCLVVDDEPIAQNILAGYIAEMEMLTLTKKCINAIEATNVLQQESIDLIFLDIEMPKMNGLSFLANLENPPKVIITTAYREHALEGFELNVVDYLMKPISIERFMKAVQKALSLEGSQGRPSGTEYIYLKSDKKMVQIFLNEILFIEGLSNYVKIHLQDRLIISYQTLGHLETTLPPTDFLRIHRSFIVAKRKVSSYTSSTLEVGSEEIPIGGSYKEKVLTALEEFNG